MSRFKTGAALLGVALVFFFLEVAVQWKNIFPAQTIEITKKEEVEVTTGKNTTVGISFPNSSQPIIEQVVLPHDFFNTDHLLSANYQLKNGRYALALFQHAPVMAQRDLFYPVTFTLEENGRSIGTVSRILPSEEMSSARLFSLVRQKLESVVEGKETNEFNIQGPYNTVGEANFYLNDRENFPNTVFMITRTKTKVLAFQIDIQYHAAAKEYIHLFFQ